MSTAQRTRRLGPDTELKAQLRQRHWQTHRVFLREYDKAAARIDEKLVGTGPLKAQFYRWLAGDIKTLPFPDHCRVLEAMLPGHTAAELFTAVPRPAGESHGSPAGRVAPVVSPPTGVPIGTRAPVVQSEPSAPVAAGQNCPPAAVRQLMSWVEVGSRRGVA
ncbi:hypothetical protein [Nocardia sp. NPDC127526]|uniref:hypothetical protein n=1 Tax=Nocardia sp. NPDC127526 TaxID=3345393 RepID=UPI003643A4E5